MRKFLLIILVMLGTLSFKSNAQVADLETKILSISDSIIHCDGTNYMLEFSIKNFGPDPVIVGETIFVKSPISPAEYGFVIPLTETLSVGDSLLYSLTLTSGEILSLFSLDFYEDIDASSFIAGNEYNLLVQAIFYTWGGGTSTYIDPIDENNYDFEKVYWCNTCQVNIELSTLPIDGGTVTGSGIYDCESSITIEAVPNVGYSFSGWLESGAVVSTSNVYTFTGIEDRDLVANFALNEYTVSTFSEPLIGGTTIGAGDYYYGTYVSVVATPAVGYTFSHWTKDGEILSTDWIYTFEVVEDIDFTAHFTINEYVVTTSPIPLVGGITSGGGLYDYGTEVIVTASPNEGYTFINWTVDGEVVSTEEEYNFIINENVDLIANFILNEYTITATSSPLDGGFITGAGTYDFGTEVTVSAAANEGYTFINWTEDGVEVSTNENYSFSINSDRELLCNFQSIPNSINSFDISKQLKVYPIPFDQILNVQWEDLTVQELQIYDVKGKEYFSELELVNSNIQINTQNMPSGVYFMRVITEKGIYNLKVVKE